MIFEKLCYVVVFLSEALTAWLYLEYVFDRKRSAFILGSVFLSGYGILFLASEWENTTVNALLFCIINYMLIRRNYRCSRKATLLHTAFLCFIMAGSEVVVALVFNVFGYDFSAHKNSFSILFSQILLSKLLYLIFAVIGSRTFSSHKEQSGEPKFMVLFCSLPILSASIAILSVYLGMTSGVTTGTGIVMLITTVALLSVNLIFLTLYNYIEKSHENFLTLQLSIQKEQADVNYYKALQEQFENQRILMHDLKKHLGIIDAIAKQCGAIEVERYISTLNTTWMPSNQARLCTDPILNLILLRFRDECRESGVDFQCDVRENVSTFMDASSITALYGNLLSNAIEAASMSTNGVVELSVTWNEMQSVIVISVLNSCELEPTSNSNGGYWTRKENNSIHGIGLRSIERVVKRYHGVATMYYDKESRVFHHVIQFPQSSSLRCNSL